jgi:putative exporter of polyketide antibiotics
MAKDLEREMQGTHAEPLLPIEKTLITWSLGIGIVLLVVLALFNKYFPI